MKLNYYDILVRPSQQGSKEKLLFWAQAEIDSGEFTGETIILWGTVGGAVRGAIQHQVQRWKKYRVRREARLKKFNQSYFVPDNKTMEQVVGQLEQHATWVTLKN